MDAPKRARLWQATEVAMADVGIIPLYHQESLWTKRKGVAYIPARTNGRSRTSSASMRGAAVMGGGVDGRLVNDEARLVRRES